ncbi:MULTISPECIES: hypothetical protein [Ruminococcus]|uniref:Uncharacterized protein n=1 Tax=Ruminococcus flavefaciens TaxID=1265 RepID=A0A1M7L7K6_RUMFL|nr:MULTISPECIES: hypothetical protein [Ruminococcus]MCR4796708.1 hypothetical protein [Ruminococcus sp.]SHM74124.1 hypothetical protein SAMN04487860_11228 [Ruminococcus flavefaciens]
MKTTFKRIITAIAAAAMCAVPMAGSFSASAADRILNIDKATRLELSKADLTKINSASLSYELKEKIGTLDIDTKIPIDPINPTIPDLPKIKEVRFVEPDIRDIRITPPQLLRPDLKPITFSQIVEEVFTLSYVSGKNTITVVIGYTTDGKYIMEYWQNGKKNIKTGKWYGYLINRKTANDPAANATLVSRVTKTEYYLGYNYYVFKEITGYTKGGNFITEVWRLNNQGKWVLVSRKITKPVIMRKAVEVDFTFSKEGTLKAVN